ncbi:MAG: ribbon-helix-helix protein, CopG family [Luteolibacter sp.]
MRTIIEVPDEMIRSLDLVSGSEKRSRAALIREAINDYLDKRAVPTAEVAFGLWKDHREDGVEYQNKLRSEWERR